VKVRACALVFFWELVVSGGPREGEGSPVGRGFRVGCEGLCDCGGPEVTS
jgi:hypothetical protein